MDELTAVEPRTDNPGRVFFGAWVQVVDEHDTEHCYRIVGSDETDAASGAISLNSPVATALLGKQVGDAFSVELPGGRRELEILAIDYGEPTTAAD